MMSRLSMRWRWPVVAVVCLAPLLAQGDDAPHRDFLELAAGWCSGAVRADRPVARGRLPLGGDRFAGFADFAQDNGDILRAYDPDPRSGARIYELFNRSERGLRAALSGRLDADCRAVEGREIHYLASGHAETIEHLGADLVRTGRRELLNPPVPAGSDPGGVRVALVDSGVNYLIPEVARALARDEQGRSLGYDFREMDDRPFDVDPLKRGPFAPVRHGTSVASVLLAHAQGRLSLVPYSFPGNDFRRFRMLVDDLRRKQVRIVNMSIGNTDPRGQRNWQEIVQAMASVPEVLFVLAAGNEGRDLGDAAAATSRPANVLVVGAVDASGSLSRLSNHGAGVDVAALADPVAGRGFDWRPRDLRGTSFAAPQIVALAAGILQKEPGLDARELKRRICSAATPVRGEREIACGYIEARL